MPDLYEFIFQVEVVLPFILLSLYLAIVIMRRKKQDRKSLQKLITSFKDKEDARKQAVLKFLKNKVGLEKPAIEETSVQLNQARKSFLQKIITAFLTREEESIANLDNELSVITKAYQELSIAVASEEALKTDEDDNEPMPAPTPTQAEPDQKLVDEVARLKKENKNLKIEVHTTLSTLNNIFGEYTSMFGEESERKDMSVDQILDAMESFGSDQVEAAASTDSSADEMISELEAKAAEAEPSWDEAFEEAEAEPVKAEEPTPEPEAEPSWDEAFEEAEAEPVKAEEPTPEPEAEPSWDEAFEEAEAEPVKAEEPTPEPEAEPSWDEAFEEAEAEPVKAEEPTPEPEAEPSWDEAFEEAEAEPVKVEPSEVADDGWGDDDGDDDDLDEDDLDEMQPDWGNAMEDDNDDEDDKK